ncbi:Uncharacterized protein OBRU01_04401 [Operophtera brumata]|uniref:Uncharacterized protein n=1 Tax=Operophtera brumata TaxID=104452 RepID=A0A0L7LP06_OPEBR|nr:Uncharacterized protein OBRU01_04401 [Operophtera brumata]
MHVTKTAKWRSKKSALRNIMAGSFSSSFPIKRSTSKVVTRRFDDLLPLKHDIFKEHAKLVQDINGLKQVVFVAPLVDDNRDYDESIFHEIIETFSTTTPKPPATKATRTTKPSSIPIILLGGASNRQIVKSQPLNFPKSTVNLVGTTGSPLLKHPYPFVMQGPPQRPLRVCMPTMALSTTTRRPTLWERLIKTLLPR